MKADYFVDLFNFTFYFVNQTHLFQITTNIIFLNISARVRVPRRRRRVRNNIGERHRASIEEMARRADVAREVIAEVSTDSRDVAEFVDIEMRIDSYNASGEVIRNLIREQIERVSKYTIKA